MTLEILLFLVGLMALVIGAEVLVAGASRLARNFGISPLVIGLTVVAFGTSAPEFAVTGMAALDGRADIAVGNVVGSNIFNVLLILGVAAAIAPLAAERQVIRQEVPIMVGASALVVALLLNGTLSRIESAVIFALLLCYVFFLVHQARRGQRKAQRLAATQAQATTVAPKDDEPAPQGLEGLLARIPAPVLVLVGLVLLTLGGDWLVDSASSFARALGVSDLVIGLTVVAIGTSMPELATSVMAVLRGERDMAVGNVMGSNIFNLLGCLGLAGMLSPAGLPANDALMNFDIWVMLAVACLCLPIVFTERRISRWEGWLLLGYCAAYLTYTLLGATHHDALPAFSFAMVAFVLPITLVLILASVVRSARLSRS